MNRKFSFYCGRRGGQDSSLTGCRERSNGFTLMELLIVMAIIAILMLIAIPTVGSLKKRANDLSAVNSVQTINKVEGMYESTYTANGYACTLGALGGDPSAGAPTPAAAQLIQGDLSSGFKSGYVFIVACKDKVTVNGVDRYTSYTVTAVPQTVGKTGDRGFCSDQFGTIKYDPAGGTNCTQPLQ
jgi:type IV pilus assembly protein PilA